MLKNLISMLPTWIRGETIYLWDGVRSRLSGRPITIMMFHSINTVDDHYTISPETFRNQIEFIQDNYEIIRLNEIKKSLSQSCRSRKVVITFDDAFSDYYQHAYPILEKLGVPSTVFVPTGYIGGCNQWDYPYDHCSKKALMTEKQLQQLSKTGLVDMGSHTVDHLRMSSLSPAKMRNQAAISKRKLEEILSAPITMFAYPYGTLTDFSFETKEALAETGYEIAVTARWGTWNTTDLLRLKRIFLKEADCYDEIRRKIEGYYDWLPFLATFNPDLHS